MPEATIDENRDLASLEHKVGTTGEAGPTHNPSVDALLHQMSPQSFLCCPAMLWPNKRHYSRTCLRSYPIHLTYLHLIEEFPCPSILRSSQCKIMKKSANQPIALDFFCGAGGLSLGFHQAGFRVAAAFDIDPVHVSTYGRNFPRTLATQVDVGKLTAAAVRKHAQLPGDESIDVVYGGPPCQGFSLIGRRDSDDPRNLLLVKFAKLIADLQPRYFVIENVAGLVLGAARRVLAKALRILHRAGYRWVTPIRILDAHDYGVPQTRKRVIVLGYRRGAAKPSYPRKKNRKTTVRDAIGDLYVIGRRKSLLSSDTFDGSLGKPSRYAQTLRRAKQRTLSGCRRCTHKPEIVKRFKQVKPGSLEPISRFVKLRLGKPAPTLRAGTAKDKGSYTAPRPIHPTQNRCITVREAARLHSFPDSFVFHSTQWHGFRQVGNSVPPKLAVAIATSVIRSLKTAEVTK